MKQQPKEREVITAWITAYALSAGIQKVQAEVIREDVISYKGDSDTWSGSGYAHGKNWHRTEAAAIARAEEMRTSKLKSIDKQIAKLKALKFEVAK